MAPQFILGYRTTVIDSGSLNLHDAVNYFVTAHTLKLATNPKETQLDLILTVLGETTDALHWNMVQLQQIVDEACRSVPPYQDQPPVTLWTKLGNEQTWTLWTVLEGTLAPMDLGIAEADIYQMHVQLVLREHSIGESYSITPVITQANQTIYVANVHGSSPALLGLTVASLPAGLAKLRVGLRGHRNLSPGSFSPYYPFSATLTPPATWSLAGTIQGHGGPWDNGLFGLYLQMTDGTPFINSVRDLGATLGSGGLAGGFYEYLQLGIDTSGREGPVSNPVAVQIPGAPLILQNALSGDVGTREAAGGLALAPFTYGVESPAYYSLSPGGLAFAVASDGWVLQDDIVEPLLVPGVGFYGNVAPTNKLPPQPGQVGEAWSLTRVALPVPKTNYRSMAVTLAVSKMVLGPLGSPVFFPLMGHAGVMFDGLGWELYLATTDDPLADWMSGKIQATRFSFPPVGTLSLGLEQDWTLGALRTELFLSGNAVASIYSDTKPTSTDILLGAYVTNALPEFGYQRIVDQDKSHWSYAKASPLSLTTSTANSSGTTGGISTSSAETFTQDMSQSLTTTTSTAIGHNTDVTFTLGSSGSLGQQKGATSNLAENTSAGARIETTHTDVIIPVTTPPSFEIVSVATTGSGSFHFTDDDGHTLFPLDLTGISSISSGPNGCSGAGGGPANYSVAILAVDSTHGVNFVGSGTFTVLGGPYEGDTGGAILAETFDESADLLAFLPFTFTAGNCTDPCGTYGTCTQTTTVLTLNDPTPDPMLNFVLINYTLVPGSATGTVTQEVGWLPHSLFPGSPGEIITGCDPSSAPVVTCHNPGFGDINVQTMWAGDDNSIVITGKIAVSFTPPSPPPPPPPDTVQNFSRDFNGSETIGGSSSGSQSFSTDVSLGFSGSGAISQQYGNSTSKSLSSGSSTSTSLTRNVTGGVNNSTSVSTSVTETPTFYDVPLASFTREVVYQGQIVATSTTTASNTSTNQSTSIGTGTDSSSSNSASKTFSRNDQFDDTLTSASSFSDSAATSVDAAQTASGTSGSTSSNSGNQQFQSPNDAADAARAANYGISGLTGDQSNNFSISGTTGSQYSGQSVYTAVNEVVTKRETGNTAGSSSSNSGSTGSNTNQTTGQQNGGGQGQQFTVAYGNSESQSSSSSQSQGTTNNNSSSNGSTVGGTDSSSQTYTDVYLVVPLIETIIPSTGGSIASVAFTVSQLAVYDGPLPVQGYAATLNWTLPNSTFSSQRIYRRNNSLLGTQWQYTTVNAGDSSFTDNGLQSWVTGDPPILSLAPAIVKVVVNGVYEAAWQTVANPGIPQWLTFGPLPLAPDPKADPATGNAAWHIDMYVYGSGYPVTFGKAVLVAQDQATALLGPSGGAANRFGQLTNEGIGALLLVPGNNMLTLVGEDALGRPVDLEGVTMEVEVTPQSRWLMT